MASTGRARNEHVSGRSCLADKSTTSQSPAFVFTTTSFPPQIVSRPIASAAPRVDQATKSFCIRDDSQRGGIRADSARAAFTRAERGPAGRNVNHRSRWKCYATSARRGYASSFRLGRMPRAPVVTFAAGAANEKPQPRRAQPGLGQCCSGSSIQSKCSAGVNWLRSSLRHRVEHGIDCLRP
jgi:hypothetical protein